MKVLRRLTSPALRPAVTSQPPPSAGRPSPLEPIACKLCPPESRAYLFCEHEVAILDEDFAHGCREGWPGDRPPTHRISNAHVEALKKRRPPSKRVATQLDQAYSPSAEKRLFKKTRVTKKQGELF